MIDMSRMPPIARFSVRGIGVAVSVRTSTSARNVRNRFLLAHAEAMFFVDDHEAEFLERERRVQQLVRADDDVDCACAQPLAHRFDFTFGA